MESTSAADGQFDPREISGYKLKELIWTDWRSEWEPRPASPSSIRLIILGRLLEDKAALKGMRRDDIVGGCVYDVMYADSLCLRRRLPFQAG